jgi:hypothetical protein
MVTQRLQAHLRHLGRRRNQLITAATASVQRVRDFLSVAWPVVTETCARPFESVTWLAAMRVVTSRCGADPGRLAAMGVEAFTALVRRAMPGWTAIGHRPGLPGHLHCAGRHGGRGRLPSAGAAAAVRR